MSIVIQPPYPTFFDSAGDPLENGYVWLGVANLPPQTNPIAVYWDSALTQPATQPIRTINGYLSNAGTPGVIYVTSACSVLVQNKNSVTVYSIGQTDINVIGNGDITTSMLANGAVTTAKLADGAVTTAKLADGAAALAKLDTTGSSGQVLTAQGSGNAPIWVSPSTVAQLQPITASIASNAITVTPSALSLDFRSATLTNGAVTRVSGTPAALTIASTDSFGLVTAAGNQRIAILAINNAGTIELAASALAGGVGLDETGVITTVTSATSGTQIKSATARSNVAYRVIGFVDATFTTATGWGSLTVVQGQGGQALAGMSSLGYGQTWQNLTGSRSLGTTYYNTTGRTIAIAVHGVVSSTSQISITVDGVTNFGSSSAGSTGCAGTAIIPPGDSYSVSLANYSSGLYWAELR